MDPSTSTRDGDPNSECLRRGTFSILIFGASDPKIIKNPFELKICLVYLNFSITKPPPFLTKETLVSGADFLFQDLAMAIPPSEARGVSVVSWDCSDGTLAVDMLPDISGWDLLGVCQNGCFRK